MKSKLKNRVSVIIVVVALAVIPLIYGGALTWSNIDPTHRLDTVPAAVVDLDQPAASGSTTVDLGAQIAKKLVSDHSDQDFDWTSTDAASARKGLADGRYLAVITLPRGLSAGAVSLGGKNASDAAASTVTIATNDGQNYIVGTIAREVGQTITSEASAQVSAAYLDQVYLGFNDLSDKLGQAASGARQLAGGASTLATGTAELTAGAASAASGAASLDTGAAQLASGTGALATGTAQVSSGAAALAKGASTLATGADALSSGATTLQTQAAVLPQDASELATGASRLNTAVDSYAQGVDRLAAACAQLPAVPDPYAAQLCQGINTLTGAATADGGYANSTALTAGAQGVAQATSQLNQAAPALSSGVKTLVGAAQSVGSGADKLSSAASTLAGGAASAASGAKSVDQGAQQTAAGAHTLAGGVAHVASGAKSTDAGAQQLAGGASTLSGKLADGVAAVPTYTAAQRSHLGGVAATPVAFSAQHANAVPSYGYGLSPYFLSLGMWVGGLAIFMILRALSPRRIAAGKPVVTTVLLGYARGAAISVAQAIALYLVVVLGIGVHPAHPAGLFGIVVLAGLAFTAVNHLLMLLLGGRGRFIGLILTVLQLAAAGATYPIQTTPGFFQGLHGWIPLSYSVDAIRKLVAGGTVGIGHDAVILGCWLFGALAVSVAVTLARRARHAQLLMPDVAL